MASIETDSLAASIAGAEAYPITTESAVFMFTLATGLASGAGNYIASRRLSDVNADEIDLAQMMPVFVSTFAVTIVLAIYLTPNDADWPISELPGR